MTNIVGQQVRERERGRVWENERGRERTNWIVSLTAGYNDVKLENMV